MNEVYVAGLAKAMKAKANKDNVVAMQYMGEMYERGQIFKVVGTNIEGSPVEIVEASQRAGVTCSYITSRPDPVIQKAEQKLEAIKNAKAKNNTPR
jgi:hypothetical protein